MSEIKSIERDPLYVVSPSIISQKSKRTGVILVRSTFILMITIGLIQGLYSFEKIDFGFSNWRPLLYAYILWAIAIGYSRVLIYGEKGKRILFVFPAVMFIISIVGFPLLFGLYISFTDWNLSSLEGKKFNGLDNFYQMLSDPYYWNAMKNMVYYILAVLVEFAIAFLLAILLNSQIRGRKFFRVSFLIPLMLSPVAVSWMIGKSMLEQRFGPVSNLARALGWETPTFYSSPEIARLTMMYMDAWTFIPLMIIMLLAGLQALPKEVLEAAKVDGAGALRRFWHITLPQLANVLFVVVLLRTMFMFTKFDVIWLVTGSGGIGFYTKTLPIHTYMKTFGELQVGAGAALSMMMFLMLVVFASIYFKLYKRDEHI